MAERTSGQPGKVPSSAGEDLPPIIQMFRDRRRRIQPGEVCDFCRETLDAAHGHVLDIVRRTLYCACRACYLLFSVHGAGGGRLRAVPDQVWAVLKGEWLLGCVEAVCGPVQVAFAFRHSPTGTVISCALGPNGIAERILPPGTEVCAQLFDLIEPDVEAVLCWRRPPLVEVFVVPIDQCYELVGRLRRAQDASMLEQEIVAFFTALHARSKEWSA